MVVRCSKHHLPIFIMYHVIMLGYHVLSETLNHLIINHCQPLSAARNCYISIDQAFISHSWLNQNKPWSAIIHHLSTITNHLSTITNHWSTIHDWFLVVGCLWSELVLEQPRIFRRCRLSDARGREWLAHGGWVVASAWWYGRWGVPPSASLVGF